MADQEKIGMSPISQFRRKKRNQIFRAIILAIFFIVIFIKFGSAISGNIGILIFICFVTIVIFDIFYMTFSMKCPRCKSRVRSYVDSNTGIAYPHLLSEKCSKCGLDFRVTTLDQ
jgi:DNA-directed RNA polymerase subunit RPC12/RpoP